MSAGHTLLVIPCYRERARLPDFLPRLCRSLADSGLRMRVRVVDDGSGPEEQQWLRDYIAGQRHEFALLDPPQLNPENAGKGGAVYSGWADPAGAVRLAFADADGAIPPQEIIRLSGLAELPDFSGQAIYAVRTGEEGTTVTRTLGRRIAGTVFRFLVRRMFRFPVPDTQCGFKIVPADEFAAVASQLTETRFCFDVELTARMLANGVKIHSVPIDWSESPGSRLRPGSAWTMFQSLRSLRLRLREDFEKPARESAPSAE